MVTFRFPCSHSEIDRTLEKLEVLLAVRDDGSSGEYQAAALTEGSDYSRHAFL